MVKQTYNPEFRSEESCEGCPVPLMTREEILEVGCPYALNMASSEAASGVLTMADVVEGVDVESCPSPFSEPGSPEREALKTVVDGPWGRGAAGLETLQSQPESVADKPASVSHDALDTLKIAESFVDNLMKSFAHPSQPTPKQVIFGASVRGNADRVVDELLALIAAPNPEEHMRGKLIESLTQVKTLMENSVLMAVSFGWTHVEVELINVVDFLSRAISAAEQIIKEPNPKV